MALPKSTFNQEEITDAWLNEMAQLVASRQSVSIAGTGTYTLSSTEYPCRVLELTGVLTGNRNVVVPTEAGRTWVVFNNTSGSYTVTVKTSAGAGIAIQQGYCAVVYCNGTDVLRACPDTAADGSTYDLRFTTVTGNNQTGTSYTFVLTDAGKCVEGNNASAITFTVPPNSSVAFPTGTVIEVWQQGAGQITLAAGGGVTLRSNGAKLKLNGQYASASLRKRATDEWVVCGDLTT